MKYLCAMVAVLITLGPVPVHALDANPLTSDQVEYIRNNCNDTQIALRQVHITDALAYVNLSQQYEIIATRLMAPMNSRVLLNKLDGVAITKTAVDFNNNVTNFRDKYTAYNQSAKAVLDMNCYDRPIEFYDLLVTTLAQRTATRDAIQKLSDLTTQYRSQIQDIQKQTAGGVR